MSTPLSFSDPSFWTLATPGELFHDGDVFFVPLEGDARMVLVLKKAIEPLFNIAINRYQSEFNFRVVINGGMVGFAGSDPAKFLSRLLYGQSVAFQHEGLLVEGPFIAGGIVHEPIDSACPSSKRELVHVTYNEASSPRYAFGIGRTPQHRDAGMGGLIPLIINGLKYGRRNVYTAGVAPNPELICPPRPGDVPFLSERYNTGLTEQHNRGKATGKTILAQHGTTGRLLVIAQEDFYFKGVPAFRGTPILRLRNQLYDLGITNAVSFDGSDSSLLVHQGEKIVRQGFKKDLATVAGLGFV